MKRRKFTTKLLCYNVALVFAIMLAAITAFYFWVVRDTEKRAIEDFETVTEKAALQFDNLVYNMDKTALQIAANPNIVSWFEKIPEEQSENYFEKNPLIESEAVKLLNSFNFKKDGNTRICLYNDYGDFVYSAITMTTIDGVKSFFESEDFKAVKRHFSGNNVFSMFREPGPDVLNTSALPSPDYFSIIREIKDYYSGTQQNGYVEVQQSVTRMDEIFDHLGDSCYAAVYDKNGKIIYMTPSLQGQSKMIAVMESLVPENFPMGVSVQEGDYFSHFKTEEAPLHIMFFKEAHSVVAPLNGFIFFLVVVFVTISAAAFVSERMLIVHLSKPLTELSQSVQNINIDNLRLELEETSSNDELQAVNEVFNKVLSHLETAIEQKILSQTNELKSHLFALQAQMNPHFIYNTLAIINMEAEIDGNEKTVQICQALSKMLKYTSSMGDGMATLKDEIAHTRNYLELMKQRYECSFEYTIEEDPSMESLKVSKLLVQPICENCFNHAFGSIEDVRKIDVKTYHHQECWFVTVEDNGCGVDSKILEEFEIFKKDLTLETMQNKLHSLSIGGLSIVNTCMRLFLIYGDDFVFDIQNTGHGAIVTLGGKMPCSE